MKNLTKSVIIFSILGILIYGCKQDVPKPTKAKELTANKIHTKYCSRCHSLSFYSSSDRKVKSLDSLVTRIGTCNSKIGLDMSEEEITKVANFLGKDYYKF